MSLNLKSADKSITIQCPGSLLIFSASTPLGVHEKITFISEKFEFSSFFITGNSIPSKFEKI